jgi:simple sugar transport system ATP-binding protein
VTVDTEPESDGGGGAGPGSLTLEVRSLSKSYGPVTALRDVSLGLRRGEVLGLLGDNGAGKSTLVKCMSGLVRPDSGTIAVDGAEVRIDSPQTARRLGIETVHQELALVGALDVAANLFLNREITRSGALGWARFLNKRRMYREAEAILSQLQIRIRSVRQPIERLSGGQRQAVSVGRAVGWGRHIVLMDEPVAALGVEQAHHVLELIDRLRHQGVAVLFISHNMQQVIDVCDRALVLRHGRKVGDVAIQDVSARDLVDLITGAKAGADDRAAERDGE